MVWHRGGHREREAMERGALAVRDPGTATGVGLSVWKLVLALQGDRDTWTRFPASVKGGRLLSCVS